MLMLLLAIIAAEAPKQSGLPLPSAAARVSYHGAVVVYAAQDWRSVESSKREEPAEILAPETNLEHWRSLLVTKQSVALMPTVALDHSMKEEGVVVFIRLRPSRILFGYDHRPWHVVIQSKYPELYHHNTILYYDLTKSPTTQKPYFEAVVCAMPNIRCKAKTLELLHQELLQRYASYLETLMEEESDSPPRLPPGSSTIDHSFIAFMLDFDEYDGARYGSGMTQRFSFTILVNH